MWCVPRLDREFIERMEDLLRLYAKPYDEREPVVCLDEKSVQLLEDTRPSRRAANGVLRRDYEYRRKGTVNIFCAVQSLRGRYIMRVTDRRARLDFARFVRGLARRYPKARTIHLVMDNLNTHNEGSLIQAFGEDEARRIWSRFTVHYTPKHGSWLDQAEIAIGMLSSECLGRRRFTDKSVLTNEVAAWARRANRQARLIRWSFTVRKARRTFRYKDRPRSHG